MSFCVVVPSKTISNLLPCVEAVKLNEPDAQIIVVDDGIGPWPCVLDVTEIVKGEKPFIFARNVNIGIRAACTQFDAISSAGNPYRAGRLDYDGVIILNDDALLQSPGGFTVMAQACEDYPEFGLLGATCNSVGNPNQWRIDGGGIYGAGLRGGALDGLRDEPRMVCFVAVYIPRSTIERVGLLSEIYTGYGCDDDDYSFEVRKAGLKIGVHDGCYVDHGSLTSSFRGPAGAGGDFRPNLKRFIEKWGHDNWGQPKETSQFAELFP